MKRGHSCRLDEHERAEHRWRRSVQVRQSDGRRRDQWLLGAARAAALAGRGERQVAVLPELRWVQAPHDEQVRKQSREQCHGDDATMPQRTAKDARYHRSKYRY